MRAKGGSRAIRLAAAWVWFALATLQAAHAQEQAQPEPGQPAPPAAEAEQAPGGVEAIAVTGERLSAADVQDEAQAISAFDFEALDRANITNIDGLAFNVPSLHVGAQGNQAIVTLRGIGTENASITGEPGVQFHVDGVNYARPAAARVAFFDLDAVRVVRGPHGLSGGKNSTGGAIHVITRKPHDELETEVDFEWGAYDRQRWRGAINIPLVPEVLSTRFAFIRDEHTGWQENLSNPGKDNRADDADDLGLRGQLSFRPTDTLDLLLSYNYYRAKGVGPGAKLVGDPALVGCLGPQPTELLVQKARERVGRLPTQDLPDGTQLWSWADGTTFLRDFVRSAVTRHTQRAFCSDITANQIDRPPTEDPRDARKVYLDQIQEQSNKIWGWASTLTWELPELPLLGLTQLTSITGFQSTSLSDPRDFDTIDIPFFTLTTVDNDSYQYSSELKLESVAGERLEWLTGLFFQRERSEALIEGAAFQTLGVSIFQRNRNKSYGAYASAKYHLSPELSFGVGARFNRDFKDNLLTRNNGTALNEPGSGISGFTSCLSAVEQGRLGNSLPPGVTLQDVPPECEDDWRRWTGGATLEWRPRDAHLLYLQYDTGYKAGGFVIADRGDFDPETVQAYTLGSKSRFWDDRLTLNLEAFYYDYENYQVVEIDGLSIRTENAPEARVYGIEAEFDTEPVPGLRINGQVGYLNAEYTDYESIDPIDSANAGQARAELPVGDADAIQDLSGNQMARAPKWTYTIGAEYSFPLGDWGTLTPRIQYYWQDDTYYRAYNGCAGPVIERGLCRERDIDLQEAYHKTDIKLIWNSPEERWSFEAYVENLEDDDVFQNLLVGSQAVGSPALAQYSAPRIYGFRVGFRY
jgi:iron complex outermembrane receptor protein